jgi:hypothetical protein
MTATIIINITGIRQHKQIGKPTATEQSAGERTSKQISRPVWNLKVRDRIHNIRRTDPILSQTNPVRILTYYTLLCNSHAYIALFSNVKYVNSYTKTVTQNTFSYNFILQFISNTNLRPAEQLHNQQCRFQLYTRELFITVHSYVTST